MMKRAKLVLLLLCGIMLVGCNDSTGSNLITSATLDVPPTATQPPATLSTPTVTPVSSFSAFAFPETIDPEGEYLFYLHGKIIEDQGIPAISSDYGEYQYESILEALQAHDYIVISELRKANTDPIVYARRVADQVAQLLAAGVKPEHITIVGASKGALIAIYSSHFLANSTTNYVLLGSCHPDAVQQLIEDEIGLSGNVLSIYDASDALAGSCQALFRFSDIRGINHSAELVLEVGTGHGILYQPLEEWVAPTIEWGRKN